MSEISERILQGVPYFIKAKNMDTIFIFVFNSCLGLEILFHKLRLI